MMQKPNFNPPLCTEHHIPMIWDETELTFEEDGIEIVVRHIPAWVCPHGDDAAFAPGVTDEIIKTARELIAVAKRAQAADRAFPRPEYLVKVVA
jgi:YgiT-type zinc finger domain-containing protein